AKDEPPTAILAMSDRMALIAIDWLKARGLDVPGGVSIVGFDGVPDGALCTPALTTIAQPITEIGRRAARMILDHDGTVRRETMGVELIVRASTGPARTG
ncbi:MAG: LacI family transcriptional regulator, partial [Mesorhizobium sp.]